MTYDEMKAAGKNVLRLMQYMEDKIPEEDMKRLKGDYACFEYAVKYVEKRKRSYTTSENTER